MLDPVYIPRVVVEWNVFVSECRQHIVHIKSLFHLPQPSVQKIRQEVICFAFLSVDASRTVIMANAEGVAPWWHPGYVDVYGLTIGVLQVFTAEQVGVCNLWLLIPQHTQESILPVSLIVGLGVLFDSLMLVSCKLPSAVELDQPIS